MPRLGRLHSIIDNGVYHVISRITLDRYFDDDDKDVLLRMIKHFSNIYYCKVFSYSIMGNHFHLIVQMYEGKDNTLKDFKNRYQRYAKVLSFTPSYSIYNESDVSKLKSKWAKLSEFIKDVKLSFTRYYNDKYNRKGYLWGGRFKSVLLQKGEALINCMAYIDLNPVRAGLTQKPEDYRWNSMYYHVVTNNKDKWLSLDYANPYDVLTNPINKQNSNDEKLVFYRKYLYQTGVEPHFKNGKYEMNPQLKEKIFENAEINDFKYTYKDKFMHRCRYFSDSLIIGSHDFVKLMHANYKNILTDKRTRRFTKMKNYESIYSMRELRHNISVA